MHTLRTLKASSSHLDSIIVSTRTRTTSQVSLEMYLTAESFARVKVCSILSLFLYVAQLIIKSTKHNQMTIAKKKHS